MHCGVPSVRISSASAYNTATEPSIHACTRTAFAAWLVYLVILSFIAALVATATATNDIVASYGEAYRVRPVLMTQRWKNSDVIGVGSSYSGRIFHPSGAVNERWGYHYIQR